MSFLQQSISLSSSLSCFCAVEVFLSPIRKSSSATSSKEICRSLVLTSISVKALHAEYILQLPASKSSAASEFAHQSLWKFFMQKTSIHSLPNLGFGFCCWQTNQPNNWKEAQALMGNVWERRVKKKIPVWKGWWVDLWGINFVTGTFHIKTFEDHYHRTLGSWTSSADCMSPQTLSISMFQNPAIASSAAASGEAQCIQYDDAWWWGLGLLQSTSSKQSLWSDPTRNWQLHNFEGTVRVQSSQLQEIVFFSQLLRNWKFGFCFGFKGELASSSSFCFSVDQRDGKLKLSGCSKGLIKRGFWCWFFLSFLQVLEGQLFHW